MVGVDGKDAAKQHLLKESPTMPQTDFNFLSVGECVAE